VKSYRSRDVSPSFHRGVRCCRGGHQFGRGRMVASPLGRLGGPAGREGYASGVLSFAVSSPASMWVGLQFFGATPL